MAKISLEVPSPHLADLMDKDVNVEGNGCMALQSRDEAARKMWRKRCGIFEIIMWGKMVSTVRMRRDSRTGKKGSVEHKSVKSDVLNVSGRIRVLDAISRVRILRDRGSTVARPSMTRPFSRSTVAGSLTNISKGASIDRERHSCSSSGVMRSRLKRDQSSGDESATDLQRWQT